MNDIDKLIEKSHSPGPTHFQLFFFVIGKEPTLQAKLHKCLEEMKIRKKAIQSTTEQIEELYDVIALYELDIKRMEKLPEDERKIRERQVRRKMVATEKHIETQKENLASWEKELKFLKEIYSSIELKCPLKNWADYEVQFEYWNEKIAQEIRQRIIVNAPIDMELFKTAMALPDKAPIKQQLTEYADKVNTQKAIKDKE